jgi:serine/threonine protein kinase/Leucine-rich repeat (LRR) protein
MTDEAIFTAALEKADPAARAAYLTEVCAGDAQRRRRLEGLLAAHASAASFLELPPVGPSPRPLSPAAGEKGTGDGDSGDTLGHEGDAAAEDKEPLTFLEPTTRADSLGRIGHYEVLEVLGKGGFGIVFRAFDEQLQRVVAVKVLAPALAATSPARRRFLREARSSAKVRHENVVQVYAVEEQPLPYLVMEFVPGETLQERLARTGPLEVPEAVQLGQQIAEGLAAAHGTGLIHRDIKPGNILIEAIPRPRIKITDFGLARAADDASLSQSGIVAGTPMFMAPEQASGETIDHRADLFSFGSVLYTMCSGRPPFRAKNTLAVLKRVAEDTPRPIREIIPEVPEWLCDLIAKLHAKKPADRFASAQEVADLLAQHLAQLQGPGQFKAPPKAAPSPLPLSPSEGERGRGEGVAKTPPSQHTTTDIPALRRPRWRSRRLAAAAAVLLALLGTLGLTEATGVTNLRSTIIRLFSPEGTLVVEVDDPGVSVKIDGSDIVITGAGAKEIRLKPGRYTVEATKDGKVVSRELVTVTKDGRQVVRVSQEAAPVPKTAAQKKDPDRRAAEYVLSIGGDVRVNGQERIINAAADLPPEAFRLTFVSLHENKQVTDAALAVFKDCKNVTKLIVDFTAVGDAGLAHFKDSKALTDLQLRYTRVTNAGLANFKDCKALTVLGLTCTNVSDAGLALLKDCKSMGHIGLDGTHVTDAGLAHLKDCKALANLTLAGLPISDAGLAHLKDCKSLTLLNLNETKVSDAVLAQLADCKELTEVQVLKTKLTAAGIDKLRKALPQCKIAWDGVIDPKVGFAPFTDAEVKRIAALPAAEQVEEVRKELKRRNPGFDGNIEPTIENDAVTGLGLQTEHVSDISPVRGFTKLRSLNCYSNKGYTKQGLLTDLSPLRGMPLTSLNIISSPVSDLSPLNGMPVTELNIERTQVSDLRPLKGMPLRALNLYGTPVADLTPLKGMPLVSLMAWCPQLSDLSPLKGMPLEILFCRGTKVADLTPLRGMPLRELLCCGTQVTDLSPLRDNTTLTSLTIEGTGVKDLLPLKALKLTGFICKDTEVSDLSPLKGMKLTTLWCDGTKVTDLSPLKGMPLQDLRCDFKAERDTEILRSIKTLQRINDKPAADFWKEVDQEARSPDRRAAEYVLSIGGGVKVGGDDREIRAAVDLPRGVFALTFVNLGMNKQVTDVGLAVFKDCKNLTFVGLYNCEQITDAGMAHFKDSTGLKVLQLEGVKLTDAGLAVFKDCKNLAELQLGNTQVTDAGLAYLKDCKNLTYIQLLNSPVTDVGLAHLKDCKNLRHLDLRNTQATAAGLANFKDCKNLTRLWLHATDAGLANFKDCKNLTQLVLSDNPGITDAGLAHVAGLTRLTELKLTNTQVTAKGVEGLAKALPNCKITWDGGVIGPR